MKAKLAVMVRALAVAWAARIKMAVVTKTAPGGNHSSSLTKGT